MMYRVIDEAGEVCAEINTSKDQFKKMLAQLNISEQVAIHSPIQTTLLEQMQLLAAQSKENPQLSAANSEAMCIIAKTLEETSRG